MIAEPGNVKIEADLVERAKELAALDSQYRTPWIVFDRDQVRDFDRIVQAAEEKGVGAGWSNPCFEIWLYAYFGEMPAIMESSVCCARFEERFKKITRKRYNKNDKNIYGKLMPSEMWPASRVQQLVEEIRRKVCLIDTDKGE